MTAPDLEIPLPTEGIGTLAYWNGELEQSTQLAKEHVKEWEANLLRYQGDRPGLRGFNRRDTVNVNEQFSVVENKKPQLFFQNPDILARGMRQQFTGAAPLVTAVINTKLGPDGLNAADLVDEVLNDCLITTGIGATKIGYDEVTELIDVPTGRTEEVIDPATGLPVIDPMTQQPARQLVIDPKTGQPETKQVPRVVWGGMDGIYWRRIPAADLRLPKGFVSARYDDADWIAWRFDIDEAFSKTYGLDHSNGGRALPDDVTLLDTFARQRQMEARSGYELFYRAHLFDPSERNPERIRRIVIVSGQSRGNGDGRGGVVIHENLKCQLFNEAGRFVGGLRGFPIHPLCIRPLPERTYPKSDCSVVRDLADEKSMGRTIMIQQRKRNLPVRGYNKNSVDAETIKKLESAEVQEMIAFNGDPRDQLYTVVQTAFPPENFHFDAIVQRDIERLTAAGANQQGLSGETDSATEAAIVQKAMETRMAKERQRVLAWHIRAVGKLFSLIQLYASDDEIALIVGNDGAEEYRSWQRSEIQGQFAFKLKPDSAIRTDANDERQHFLKFFNLTANHPMVNTPELLRSLAALWGLDPAKVVNAQPPPPPPQEKPKLSISIKGDDLSPEAPQYRNILKLLQLYGMEAGMSPAAAGLPPLPSNNGDRLLTAGREIPPVDRHDANLTGKRSGPPPRVS